MLLSRFVASLPLPHIRSLLQESDPSNPKLFVWNEVNYFNPSVSWHNAHNACMTLCDVCTLRLASPLCFLTLLCCVVL